VRAPAACKAAAPSIPTLKYLEGAPGSGAVAPPTRAGPSEGSSPQPPSKSEARQVRPATIPAVIDIFGFFSNKGQSSQEKEPVTSNNLKIVAAVAATSRNMGRSASSSSALGHELSSATDIDEGTPRGAQGMTPRLDLDALIQQNSSTGSGRSLVTPPPPPQSPPPPRAISPQKAASYHRSSWV